MTDVVGQNSLNVNETTLLRRRSSRDRVSVPDLHHPPRVRPVDNHAAMLTSRTYQVLGLVINAI